MQDLARGAKCANDGANGLASSDWAFSASIEVRANEPSPRALDVKKSRRVCCQREFFDLFFIFRFRLDLLLQQSLLTGSCDSS